MPDDAAVQRARLLRASRKAGELRSIRSAAKRHLATCPTADAIVCLQGEGPAAIEEALSGLRVRAVILAVDGIGEVTADEIMEALGLRLTSPLRLGDVTYGQRVQLASLVAMALSYVPPVQHGGD